ncbi:MAG: transglycosylase domain-containing protein [Myxococcota bacterium]
MGAVVGAGLVGLVVLWGWLLPALLEGRVEQMLERRLDVVAEVGDVDLGLGSVTVEQLVLQGRYGGLRIEVSEVEAKAGPSVLVRGAAGVDRVTARGVRVAADLRGQEGRASVRALRRALAGRADEGGRAEGATGGRRYAVRDLELEATAAEGDALTVRSARLAYHRGRLAGDAESVQAVAAAGHRVNLEQPSGELRSEEGAWQISALHAPAGTVLLQQRAFADPGTGDRGGASRSAAGPSGSAEGGPSASEGAEGHAPEPRAAADRATADAGASGAGDTAEPGSGPMAAVAGALERVADDATFHVGTLTVLSRMGDETQPILEDLDVRVEGRGPGVIASKGGGRPSGGGELRWEVELRPEEARAEGTLRFDRLPLALVAPVLPGVPWNRPEDARLDGELVVQAESAARLAFRGRVSLEGAGLRSERIAPEPVRLPLIALEGRGHWVPATRRLVLDGAEIAAGPATLRVSGAVEWAPEHYLFDLEAQLPSTPCGAAVGALPEDLLGEVSGFRWNGHLAGNLSVHVDSRDLDATDLEIRVADGCQFSEVPALADLRRFRGVFEHEVEEPDGGVFEMTTGPGSGNWEPIRSVSPFLVHAVLAHEDAGFFRHHGFAPWAIETALARNLKAGRYVVGASTVTMQLAKNLFLRREKTLARKVQEVLLTWWLESALDKGDILELYLNVIEYGPGIYGIRNAAWHYFGRQPSDLTVAESAFLATILPNPKVYGEEAHRRGALGPSAANRTRRLLRHMHAKGRIDEAALEHALAEIESFGFHREGDPPPEPPAVEGSVAPLPLGIADEGAGGPWSWDDVFEGKELPLDDDDPFRDLPEVDPDAIN